MGVGADNYSIARVIPETVILRANLHANWVAKFLRAAQERTFRLGESFLGNLI